LEPVFAEFPKTPVDPAGLLPKRPPDVPVVVFDVLLPKRPPEVLVVVLEALFPKSPPEVVAGLDPNNPPDDGTGVEPADLLPPNNPELVAGAVGLDPPKRPVLVVEDPPKGVGFEVAVDPNIIRGSSSRNQ